VPHAGDEVAEPGRPDRVEAVGGLVEHEQRLVAQQRLREPDALQRALAERARRLVGVLVEAERGQALVHAPCERGIGEAGEGAVAAQRRCGGSSRRHGHQLREVAHAHALHVRARRRAVHRHAPAGGRQEAEQEVDERALSRAVRAGDPEHLAARDGEGDAVERAHLAAASDR
jgi:hypothetical protein